MEPTPILINGLPGNICQTLVKTAMRDPRFRVVPFSMTGPGIEESRMEISSHTINLIQPEHHLSRLTQLREAVPHLIAVDYTHPTAVNRNAELYCQAGLPFVMGTTGGERNLLMETVQRSDMVAVISPNMAKPIVGLQAMMQWAAKEFPGLFKGYRLQIMESHQKGKADTSGTAKAMVTYFNALGVPFDASEIEMVRDPETQAKKLCVPESYIGGHGWHTYTLTSNDETVKIEFTHNVNGREVYAIGTLDAVNYLSAKVRQGEKGKVYSMIDVLKGV